jgi:acylphosphatase
MDDQNTARAHIFISGRVQGVFFRGTTRQKARSMDVNGWIRNLRDGRVEAVFEGPEDQVRSLVNWCHKGPRSARVDSVETDWEVPQGETGFKVRY